MAARLNCLAQGILVFLAACGVAGCAGGLRPTGQPAPGLPVDLPALASLPRGASDLPDWSQDGAQFEPALPNAQVAAEFPAGHYTPAVPAAPAYAIYRFDLTGLSGAQALGLEWETPAQPTADLFVALANWQTGRWAIFSVPDIATLSIPQIDPFVRDDGTAFVTVIPYSTGNYRLAGIAFPGPPGSAPQVTAVAPKTGASGTSLAFTADVTGLQPLEYDWDFGAACTPGASSETVPVVAATGAPASYDCSLTVTNAAGVTKFPFVLQITAPPLTWTHTLGSPANETGRCCVADTAGNLYYGAYNSSWLIGKYDPAGSLVWQKQWYLSQPAGGKDYLRGLAVAADGSLYASGTYDASVGSGHGVSIARFDSDGELVWARRWLPQGETTSVMGGNLVLAGSTIYVAASYKNGGDSSNAALLKFDTDGSLLSQVGWDNGGLEYGSAVAVDSSGSAFVSGYAISAGPFPPSTMEGLLLKFTPAGTLAGAQLIGGDGSQTGFVRCATDDSIMLSLKNGSAQALLQFTAAGNLSWSNKYQHNGGGTALNDVLMLPGGDCYAVGTYLDDTSGSDKNDIHLLHLASSGALDWCRSWNGTDTDHEYLHGICAAPGGQLYLLGTVPSASGGWSGSTAQVTVTPYSPPLSSVTGTVLNPNGTAADNTAQVAELGTSLVTDSGGGAQDLLVARYAP